MLTQVRTPGCATECTLAGAGPPLIVLHGAGGRASAWREVIPQLARGFQVIVPDIPGHGDSQSPGALSTRRFYSSWLKRFTIELRLSRPRIVGHSLGGAIALALAVQQPDLIDRLGLVNSIGLGAPAPRASLLLLAALFTPSEEAALALMGAAMFGEQAARPKALRYDLVARSGPLSRGLRGFWLVFSRTWDIARSIRPRDLEQIRVPTLIVWGVDDPHCPHRPRPPRRAPHGQLPGEAHARRGAHSIPSATAGIRFDRRALLTSGLGRAPEVPLREPHQSSRHASRAIISRWLSTSLRSSHPRLSHLAPLTSSPA